jgi:hypothetical protein
MKLQELTGYKKATDYQNSTIQQYLARLQQSNKLEIRNGKFAIVLVPEDKPFVYKLWTKDPAFDYWLDLCKKNQNLYFLPKFIGRTKKIANVFVRRSSASDYINVAQMEKLTPLPDKYKDAFGDIRRYLSLNELRYPEDIADIVEYLERDFEDSFCKWVKDIKIFLQKHPTKYTKDIHPGNVMMRGDDFVLVDPYVVEDWFYTNSARLVNHMDDYTFRDTDDEPQSEDNETYITGLPSRSKPTIVSKDLAKNNISIWKSEEQLNLYGVTGEDWPKNIRIDSDLLDSFPIPFPKQFVDVLISKCVDMYYRGFGNLQTYQMLMGNVEDSYFYEQYAKRIKFDDVLDDSISMSRIFSFVEIIDDEKLRFNCVYALTHTFISNLETYQHNRKLNLFYEVIIPMLGNYNDDMITSLEMILPKYIDMSKDIWKMAKETIDENKDNISERIIKIFE